MKRAFCFVNAYDPYPHAAIEQGFGRLGYQIVRSLSAIEHDDVIVTWTPWAETIAGLMLKRHQNQCIVFENGYVPLDTKGRRYFLIGRGGFHGIPGSTHANERSPPDRWDQMGLAIKPMQLSETGTALCIGQRGHDDTRWSMPIGYAKTLVARARKEFPHRQIVFRPHPGRWNHALQFDLRETPWLTIDGGDFNASMRAAAVVLTWNSKSLCEACRLGKRGMYFGPHHILSRLANRESFFHDISYAQWTDEEIATGEPMKRLIE